MALTGMPGLIATQNPAASLNHPAPLATSGRIIFVSSTRPGRGDDNVGDDPLRPKATWAGALRTLRTSGYTDRGDQIWLMPGHQETMRISAAIPMDVAGVDAFGMGRGASRPRITFESDTAASIAISAANCGIYNVVGIAGIAGLTQPFDVTASDCTLNIEWQDASVSTAAARAVLATSADRLDFTVAYRGFAGTAQVVNAIRLIGCNHVAITLDAYGNNSSAWVEMITTLCRNVFVRGKTYADGAKDGSRNVRDTTRNSVWGAEIWDLGRGVVLSGGSGLVMSPQNLSEVRLKAVLSDAGLLTIVDDVALLKAQMNQVRFGLSNLLDIDLSELVDNDLSELVVKT